MPLAMAVTTHGAPRMPTSVTSANANVSSRATRSSRTRTSSGARVLRAWPNMGTKACENAPSANSLRSRLGMRKATQNASVRGPAPKELAISTSRARPVMRENSVKLLTVAADLSKFIGRLLRTHADGAVQAYGFAVQHFVRNNAVDQLGIILGPAQPGGEGDAGGQGVLHLLRHAEDHGRAENAGGDGDAAYPRLGQIASDGQSHTDHACFRGGIRGLSDLSVIGGDRGGVDQNAALARGLGCVVAHGRCGQARHIEC